MLATTDRVLHTLEQKGCRPAQRGTGHVARCPAHEDRTPSLSIGTGDQGQVLLHCHAGCQAEAVVEALGLTMADLFPESLKQRAPDRARRRKVATYDYTDARGMLLYQTLRYDPKDFRQRQPDGRGGWIWNLRGIEPVLYRLPRLKQAIEEDRPVFVVEGEKDVHALEGLGLTATCNPMGAGKWRASYTVALRGARVVILPDNDHPGRGHARQVAQSLAGVARDVRIVALPGLKEKGDASDWVQHGGTAQALLDLANGAPQFEPDGAQAGRASGDAVPVALWGFKRPPPLDWLVQRFIPKGYVTLLAADGGTGKSYLGIYLGICVCLGRAFLGLPVRRGRVLYVDYELDEDEQKRRVWRVAAGMGTTVDDPGLAGRFYYHRPRHQLSSDRGHDEVIGLVEGYKIDLVVLDSLTVGSGTDVSAQEDVTRIMQRFKAWGTVFAIDHVSGQAARGNQSRARPFGSVFKRNIARSTYALARAEAGGYLLHADKNNFGPQQDLVCYGIDFEEDEVTFQRLDHTDEAMTGAMQHMTTHEVTLLAVKELCAETASDGRPIRGSATAEDVVAWRADHDEATPVKAGTVRNHFTVLRRRGCLELLGDGSAVPIHDAVQGAEEKPPSVGQNGHSRFTMPIGTVNREWRGEEGGEEGFELGDYELF